MLEEHIRALRKRIAVLDTKIRKLAGPKIGTKYVKVTGKNRALVVEALSAFKRRLRGAKRR
jgi:hypothetical protein